MELNLSLNLDVRLLLLWVLILLFLCLDRHGPHVPCLRVHSKEMLASAVAACFPYGLPIYRVRRVVCGAFDALGARKREDAAMPVEERAFVSQGSRSISAPC